MITTQLEDTKICCTGRGLHVKMQQHSCRKTSSDTVVGYHCMQGCALHMHQCHTQYDQHHDQHLSVPLQVCSRCGSAHPAKRLALGASAWHPVQVTATAVLHSVAAACKEVPQRVTRCWQQLLTHGHRLMVQKLDLMSKHIRMLQLAAAACLFCHNYNCSTRSMLQLTKATTTRVQTTQVMNTVHIHTSPAVQVYTLYNLSTQSMATT
jgi:hypothetical protein